jgi:hypothetical protein
MKSKPNRNLDAAARNRVFVLSRAKNRMPAPRITGVKGRINNSKPIR